MQICVRSWYGVTVGPKVFLGAGLDLANPLEVVP
jgi:hypothetical protein